MKEEMEWRRAGRLFSRAEWRRTGEQWISVACTSKEAIIVCTNHAGQFLQEARNQSNTISFFVFCLAHNWLQGDFGILTSSELSYHIF
jgi:hypothetical protein